eukprot:TRINITY_DN2283_c0_g1_i7.p1 TRINITY_DN2283_c0_g1~~TRINITY_DN2283_c0_g1_i7.p1  ORF type:complete len:832 (-),score=261.80 TRINITY_DN2283_c0_g1_i7:245-2740(-)
MRPASVCLVTSTLLLDIALHVGAIRFAEVDEDNTTAALQDCNHDDKCMSSNGRGGHDCCAHPQGKREKQECAAGFTAKDTGKKCWQDFTTYKCCKEGGGDDDEGKKDCLPTSDKSKCSDNGNDCCADPKNKKEKQTCKDGFEPKDTGKKCWSDYTTYKCCKKKEDDDDDKDCLPTSDKSKCSDNGNDCCADPQNKKEKQTCKDGFKPKDTGKKCWSDYTTYQCCKPKEGGNETDDAGAGGEGGGCKKPVVLGGGSGGGGGVGGWLKNLVGAGGGGGWTAKFEKGEYDFKQFTGKGAKNDQTNKITVPKGCKAIMYQHGGFKGWKAEFPPGTYDGKKAFEAKGAKINDASSLKVEDGPADEGNETNGTGGDDDKGTFVMNGRGKGKKKPKKASDTAKVRCCKGDSVDRKDARVMMGKYGGKNKGCNGCCKKLEDKTYEEAESICKEKDLELCLEAQIKGKVTQGTGCGYDGKNVWLRKEGATDKGEDPMANESNSSDPNATDEEYHLAPKGAKECDSGAPASQEDCEAAVAKISKSKGKEPKRKLQVGKGGKCLDKGWGQVPPKCSAQTGGDWAAHFKTEGPDCTKYGDVYQLVCKGKAETPGANDDHTFVMNGKGSGDKKPLGPEKTAKVRCCKGDSIDRKKARVMMGDYGGQNKGCNGCCKKLEDKKYDEAEKVCKEHSLTLCTSAQIKAKVTQGTGCGYDGKDVWLLKDIADGGDEEWKLVKGCDSKEEKSDKSKYKCGVGGAKGDKNSEKEDNKKFKGAKCSDKPSKLSESWKECLDECRKNAKCDKFAYAQPDLEENEKLGCRICKEDEEIKDFSGIGGVWQKPRKK